MGVADVLFHAAAGLHLAYDCVAGQPVLDGGLLGPLANL